MKKSFPFYIIFLNILLVLFSAMLVMCVFVGVLVFVQEPDYFSESKTEETKNNNTKSYKNYGYVDNAITKDTESEKEYSSGMIDETLKIFDDVKSFRLDHFQSSSFSYSLMAKFKNLKRLYIHNCDIEEILPHIKNLPNLIEINFDYAIQLDIPKELFELTQLEYLRFNNVELLGLPAEIKNLKNLVSLDLSGNHISSLPKEIGELKNLEFLKIENNNLLSLPEEIGNLEKLKNIYFSKNKIKFLPKSIGNLKNIKIAEFDDNKIEELPKEIRNWKEASIINFNNNQIQKLPYEIGNWAKATYINFENNKIQELPNKIGNWTKIKYVNFGNNQIQKLPKEIESWKKIEEFYANNNQLTQIPKEIMYFEHLEKLDFSKNQLSQIPKGIEKLKKLEDLSFSNNKITFLPNEICNLSNLKNLSIDTNQLTYLPKYFFKLKNLENLSCKNNQIYYVSNAVSALKNLQKLNFSYNKFAYLPSKFERLSNLEELNLSHNVFEDFPNQLYKLKFLRKLYLSHNQIKDITNIWDLKKIYLLDISHNQIQKLPEKFGKECMYFDASHNKIKTLSIFYFKDVFKDRNDPNIILTDNLIENLPLELNDYNSLYHLYLSNNPIKNVPFNQSINDKKITSMDWFYFLRNKKVVDIEDLEIKRKEKIFSSRPVFPADRYNKKFVDSLYFNPNGKLIYQYFLKNHQVMQEIGFYAKEKYTSIYQGFLSQTQDLIDIELYGAFWHIQNKDFITAKNILKKVKKMLADFEPNGQKPEITFMIQESEQYGESSEQLSSKIMEIPIIKKMYLAQLEIKKNNPNAQQEEKNKISNHSVMSFLYELFVFYEDIKTLEKMMK